jgi:hypothetical protein
MTREKTATDTKVNLQFTFIEPKVAVKIKVSKKTERVSLVIKTVKDFPEMPMKVKFKVETNRNDDNVKAKDDHDLAVRLWEKNVEEIKQTQKYKDHLAAYKKRIELETCAIRTLFVAAKSKKAGWKFDGSLSTDGVAVSMQFSCSVVYSNLQGRSEKKGHYKVDSAAKYDHNLPTVVKDDDGNVVAVVLGVDPGRSNIASVSYILDDKVSALFSDAPKSQNWSLSRGAYYSKSKVLDKKQKKRFDNLIPKFESLSADGGSLRTEDDSQIKKYLGTYATFREEWYSLALCRRESRTSLVRYSGKRSMIDGFFARVKKATEKYFPGIEIHVGYGSAVMNMKPTGRGEMAVPTTGAFKACQRIFGPQKVAVTDEFRSTAVSWETGLRKDAVYKKVESKETYFTDDGKERTRFVCTLGHTAEKCMPLVSESKRALVQEYVDHFKRKRRVQRCGGVEPKECDVKHEETPKEEAYALRYPEVRGLRFCPERRIYLNRDAKAAEVIGRLRTTELMGKARPLQFHRSFKMPSSGRNPDGEAATIGSRNRPIHPAQIKMVTGRCSICC